MPFFIKDAEAATYAIEASIGIFDALATGDLLSAAINLGWTLFWSNSAIEEK